MNDRVPHDHLPPELLAAYADGELDEVARQRVEAWLDDCPAAQADLSAQEELSRSNDELWRLAEPPMPSAAAWVRVFEGVEAALATTGANPDSRGARQFRYLAPVLAVASMAAALVIAIVAIDRQQPLAPPATGPQAAAPFIPDDGDDTVFKVASADDVEFHQLPEEAAALLVVGRHPMAGVPVVLAEPADVEVFNYGTEDQSQLADLMMSIGQDSPMILSQPR